MSAKERWAIEIKCGSVPSVSKGFHLACEDVKPAKRFVAYGGKDRFTMEGGMNAISLPDLMEEILTQE